MEYWNDGSLEQLQDMKRGVRFQGEGGSRQGNGRYEAFGEIVKDEVLWRRS
jgi:hypothetical protein